MIEIPPPSTSASAVLKQDSCVAASDIEVNNQALKMPLISLNFYSLL
jgi:hypothetical protein